MGPRGAAPRLRRGPSAGRFGLEAVEVHGRARGRSANKLILGDNLPVLDALLEELEGRVDLIYADPPFATGSDPVAALEIGDRDLKGSRSRRLAPAEEPAYRDRRGRDLGPYLDALRPRLERMRALLAPAGTLFLHADRRAAHPLKLLLDEVFGEERLINEIVWCYTGPSSRGMRCFSHKHDTIFWYAKGPRWAFHVDRVRLPYKESTRRNEGRRTGFTTGDPDLVVKLHPLGKHPEDWWTIPVEAPASSRRTSYPTQKPERLLERILLVASSEGSLVADPFCGSGTTLAVAERLGRRWIGCDSSPLAIHTARKRIFEAPGHGPFEVLRSRDSRQLGPSPRGVPRGPGSPAPWGGAPRDGVLLRAGRPGSPVTAAEVTAWLDECARLGARRLQVLAREWAPRAPEEARAAAAARSIDLLLLELPPAAGLEDALDPRGPRLHELATLEARVEIGPGRAARAALEGFGFPHPERIPDGVRSRVARWSDWIDAWAVDWDWRGGPFRPGFLAYRTRRRRALPLAFPPHRYASAGRRRVAVKAVDLFGREVLRELSVSVP
ncbi:MAG: site-specific DNA-methyltransferase [Planctomycetes bacterium]|nr:site-specific DNA-methyltransferase [Planctomycetota bacterium]